MSMSASVQLPYSSVQQLFDHSNNFIIVVWWGWAEAHKSLLWTKRLLCLNCFCTLSSRVGWNRTCVWAGHTLLIYNRNTGGKKVHYSRKNIWLYHFPFQSWISLKQKKGHDVHFNIDCMKGCTARQIRFTFEMVIKSGPSKTPLTPSILKSCLEKQWEKMFTVSPEVRTTTCVHMYCITKWVKDMSLSVVVWFMDRIMISLQTESSVKTGQLTNCWWTIQCTADWGHCCWTDILWSTRNSDDVTRRLKGRDFLGLVRNGLTLNKKHDTSLRGSSAHHEDFQSSLFPIQGLHNRARTWDCLDLACPASAQTLSFLERQSNQSKKSNIKNYLVLSLG